MQSVMKCVSARHTVMPSMGPTADLILSLPLSLARSFFFPMYGNMMMIMMMAMITMTAKKNDTAMTMLRLYISNVCVHTYIYMWNGQRARYMYAKQAIHNQSFSRITYVFVRIRMPYMYDILMISTVRTILYSNLCCMQTSSKPKFTSTLNTTPGQPAPAFVYTYYNKPIADGIAYNSVSGAMCIRPSSCTLCVSARIATMHILLSYCTTGTA